MCRTQAQEVPSTTKTKSGSEGINYRGGKILSYEAGFLGLSNSMTTVNRNTAAGDTKMASYDRSEAFVFVLMLRVYTHFHYG